MITTTHDAEGHEAYSLGPGLGLVLAFSVGGEHLRAALVDAGGLTHCEEEADPVPEQLNAAPAAFLERLRELAVRTLAQGLEGDSGLTVDLDGARVLPLIGATAAWPMSISRDSYPAHNGLPNEWHLRSMRQHLSDALGFLDVTRCHAMNDANAAALSLAFDRGRLGGAGSILCVHASAGIGMGTVHQALGRAGRLPFIDAHLVSGTRGVAGNVGHCLVDYRLVEELNETLAKAKVPKGERPTAIDVERQCDCDIDRAQGHISAVLGAEALLRRLGRYRDGDSLVRRLEEVHREAPANPRFRRCLNETGQLLARALDSVVAALDPQLIFLAGPVASRYMLEGMQEQQRQGFLNDTVELGLCRPESNPVAGRRGAALAVLRAGLYRRFFDNAVYKDSGGWLGWSGWDEGHSDGSQTGATQERGVDDRWRYRPLPVKRSHLGALERYRHPDHA